MHISIGSAAIESTVRTWECPSGHRLLSNRAITVGYYADTDKGPAVCPFCIVDFLRATFPTSEVRQVQEVAVVKGDLDVGAWGAGGKPVKFVPCDKEGCILAQHPGKMHINASKVAFE